jgi:hypothetical protein
MVLTKRVFGMKTAGFSRLLLLSCALIGSAALGAAPARAGLLNDMWNSDSKPDNAAPDDGKPPRGLLNRMFGSDDSDAAKQPQPSQPAAAGQPSQAGQPSPAHSSASSKRTTQAAPPVDAAPPIQPAGQAIQPPAPEDTGMLGRAINSIGLNGEPASSKIDYSERPKLVVPPQRDLPPPREGVQRQPGAHPDERALINPPPDYLQKMRGADGNVSGLQDGDIGKEKKWFGLF